MSKSNKNLSVEECKIQASVLLKSLNSEIKETVEHAIMRFHRLPEFEKYSLDELKIKIKRKHALAVIAREKGFNSWVDLKCQVPFIIGGFLNKWFSNYAEAKSILQANGGYLLPFKKQFFICDRNYITLLGFDADDPDWKLIGYDWVNPNNREASRRLYQKWMKVASKSKLR